jgi:phosphopantothenoylcysteine decarboxylase/phosphopantothenate--cysteine ligase
MKLEGKKILLGVTGSIAAYKSVLLTRLFIKQGAEVKVVMTEAAGNFISPLTFSTLSKNPVYSSVHGIDEWNNHVELGLWADMYIIAPATANTLAKLAHGICDNIISAVFLSARCSVYVSPAMDVDMWLHPATQENISILEKRGTKVIGVEEGELASGLHGPGRMKEPEDILDLTVHFFQKIDSLKGKRILITAGPTYEAIDPVRFIGNRSSGKMGLALCRELLDRGAEVHLILGPSNQHLPIDSHFKSFRVVTAEEMLNKALELYPQADVTIMAAAVSDFKPKNRSGRKIKKKEGQDAPEIELTKTKDIAKTLGGMKKNGKVLVGFALESENGIENAKKKIQKKNLDFIVLNSLQDKGAGFGHDTNKVTIIHKDDRMLEFPLKSKIDVAKDIVDQIELILEEK